jgi:hypothetical protein
MVLRTFQSIIFIDRLPVGRPSMALVEKNLGAARVSQDGGEVILPFEHGVAHLGQEGMTLVYTYDAAMGAGNVVDVFLGHLKADAQGGPARHERTSKVV